LPVFIDYQCQSAQFYFFAHRNATGRNRKLCHPELSSKGRNFRKEAAIFHRRPEIASCLAMTVQPGLKAKDRQTQIVNGNSATSRRNPAISAIAQVCKK